MSEAISALAGARSSGVVEVTEAGLQGMITVRGDLADPAIIGAITDAIGANVPTIRRSTKVKNDRLLWMSSDELMLICPYDEAESRVQVLRAALKKHHHLIAIVSDARAQFTLSGSGAAIREVLAKLSPADLRTASLPVDEVRRTRIAQVAAAFWFESDDQAQLVCFRSVAKYVFDLLRVSSTSGSAVGYF
ncbi:MAG: sarcosine oxidase subunit gamma [Boseongicola sp.]